LLCLLFPSLASDPSRVRVITPVCCCFSFVWNSLLSLTAPHGQSSLVFAIVFVFIWIGAILVALNAVLLGGKMFVSPSTSVLPCSAVPHPLFFSPLFFCFRFVLFNSSFFQAVCVMGYSIFPLLVMAVILLCVGKTMRAKIWLRVLLIVPACCWSVWASYGLTRDAVPPKRKMLAVYPLLLFYCVLAWMIVIQPF